MEKSKFPVVVLSKKNIEGRFYRKDNTSEKHPPLRNQNCRSKKPWSGQNVVTYITSRLLFDVNIDFSMKAPCDQLVTKNINGSVESQDKSFHNDIFVNEIS